MDLCLAAETARRNAVTRNTTKEFDRAWTRWKRFLESIGIIDNPYLEDFSQGTRTRILSIFAQSIRDAEHSPGYDRTLASKTCRSAVDYVAQAFGDMQLPDPRHNSTGKLSRILQRQYKGYKNQDPPEKREKAAPVSLIKKVTQDRSTARAAAIGLLVVGAFFFAMRSCEYLKYYGERKTKRLRLRNLRFFRNNCIIPHTDPTLYASDFVTITFEDQKNDEKMDETTQQKSGDHLLCPVRSWATIVKNVLKIPGTDENSFVNLFYDNGKVHEVSAKDVKLALRSAATIMGEAALGFKPEEIGTHSLRSGAAMSMYLDEVPVYTIMLMGRWSSDAFLRYIRKQVEQFSHNVSSRMIRHQHFTHVPQNNQHVSRHDPRQHNHRDNFQTRTNMAGVETTRNTLARMALWS